MPTPSDATLRPRLGEEPRDLIRPLVQRAPNVSPYKYEPGGFGSHHEIICIVRYNPVRWCQLSAHGHSAHELSAHDLSAHELSVHEILVHELSAHELSAHELLARQPILRINMSVGVGEDCCRICQALQVDDKIAKLVICKSTTRLAKQIPVTRKHQHNLGVDCSHYGQIINNTVCRVGVDEGRTTDLAKQIPDTGEGTRTERCPYPPELPNA